MPNHNYNAASKYDTIYTKLQINSSTLRDNLPAQQPCKVLNPKRTEPRKARCPTFLCYAYKHDWQVQYEGFPRV